jgi:hypothetical protein
MQRLLAGQSFRAADNGCMHHFRAEVGCVSAAFSQTIGATKSWLL